MKKKVNYLLLTAGLAGILIGACKKDKDLVEVPEIPTNEEENITTLKLIFSPLSGGTSITYQYKDLDGPGGNPAIQDTIKLSDSTSYNVLTEFWDESKSPAVNLTSEIQNEKDDHIIVYTHTGINLSTEILDKDSKNLPLGLSTKWISTLVSNGTTKVTLKHQPGTKDGTLNNGETDLEVIFNTKIQ